VTRKPGRQALPSGQETGVTQKSRHD